VQIINAGCQKRIEQLVKESLAAQGAGESRAVGR
jgi:hypothetical protein